MSARIYRIGNVVWAPFATPMGDPLSPKARARLNQLRAKRHQGISLSTNERPLLKFLEDREAGRKPAPRGG